MLGSHIYYTKYIKRIDKFCRRAVRCGYTENCISIFDIIEQRDKVMWNKIISNERHCLYDLLPVKRTRKLREREHDFILPKVHTERFKRCFINSVFLIYHNYCILYTFYAVLNSCKLARLIITA